MVVSLCTMPRASPAREMSSGASGGRTTLAFLSGDTINLRVLRVLQRSEKQAVQETDLPRQTAADFEPPRSRDLEASVREQFGKCFDGEEAKVRTIHDTGCHVDEPLPEEQLLEHRIMSEVWRGSHNHPAWPEVHGQPTNHGPRVD